MTYVSLLFGIACLATIVLVSKTAAEMKALVAVLSVILISAVTLWHRERPEEL